MRACLTSRQVHRRIHRTGDHLHPDGSSAAWGAPPPRQQPPVSTTGRAWLIIIGLILAVSVLVAVFGDDSAPQQAQPTARSELRGKLQDVNRDASVSESAAIRTGARAMLAAVTADDGEALLSSAKQFSDACRSFGL
jgi:hypothetical protein